MAKRRKASQSLVPAPAPTAPDTDRLLGDLRGLIEAARDQVARAVNAGLVLLYWGIGERIRREILGEQRAAYGEQIVLTVSRQLTAEYGKGGNDSQSNHTNTAKCPKQAREDAARTR